VKSGWPDVSIRLTVVASIENDATADLIVIPRCCSSGSESVCVVPASTLPTSSMTPAAYSSRSVSVVLPASTCAKIPKFSECMQCHVLRVVSSLRHGHERCAHGCLLGRPGQGQCSRAPPEKQPSYCGTAFQGTSIEFGRERRNDFTRSEPPFVAATSGRVISYVLTGTHGAARRRRRQAVHSP